MSSPSLTNQLAQSGGRLLASWGPDIASLDPDLFLRYTATARLLDRMLTVTQVPVRILEVGCNGHNVLRRLLDPGLVQVGRCDVEPFGADPDFFVIPPAPPWPITDESYDAVIALEVLEHLPADRRGTFLRECLRVAKHGAIFSCPNGVPEVVRAEALASAAYRLRHGLPHPFLSEHQTHGLPTAAEITGHLRRLECPHAIFEQAPLDAWLPMLLVAEMLKESAAPSATLRRLNEMCQGGAFSGDAVAYRKIYVCAKSFDATAALEPNDFTRRVSARDGEPALTLLGNNEATLPPSSAEVAALQHMATVASAALHALAKDDQERFATLRADHRADVAALQGYLSAWLERYVVLHSFVKSLRASRVWRLLGPLRWLRRVLRPRGFGVAALVPWQHLEPDHNGPPGSWIVGGAGAHFLVPCALPAGELRVRVKMTSAVRGRFALYSDNGTGAMDLELLERRSVDGTIDCEFVVRLPQPALALRFDPLDRPSRIRLEAFDVTPVSPFAALFRSKRGPLPARAAPDQRRIEAASSSASALAGQKPPIVYVLKTVGLCGGVKVVLEHVSRLRARGHNVCVYYLEGGFDWFARAVPARQFADPVALTAALAEVRGIKIATWHETAPWVADSLRPGDRGYYLVQDIEESYSQNTVEAAAVLRTYQLGLKPLTEGTWVRDRLKQRFGLDSVFVSIGLDLDIFQPRPAARDPQLILTQARTITGGGAAGRRLKGWETARHTVLRCHDLNTGTALMTFSMEEPPPLPRELAHVHWKSPADEQLAQLYSRAGLYLMTSTHEGFGLPAAEAMACGCPVVATRAQGNEEFCIDGSTALLAPVDDVEALARQCLRLQSDPRLAAELAENAQRFIRRYTWDRVIDNLEREFAGTAAAEIVIVPPAPVRVAACELEEYPALSFDEFPGADWTVVIPTINDVTRVVRCISTCRQHAPADTTLQFVVVDDGTRDAALLQQLHDSAQDLDFELLCNRQNLGFSATVNHGLRQARGRFVLLCNNDIVFTQPCLEELAAAFASDPRLGIVGGKLLYLEGSIQHAGMDKVPGQLLWVHAQGGKPADNAEANRSRYVWSVTGAFFALRQETLQQLGGLSTAYATAYEDVDYCLHAWSQGVRVGYCATALAQHQEGGTRGATPEQKRTRPLLWAERERAGQTYFEKKWASLRYVESFEMLASAGPQSVRQPEEVEVLQ